MKGHMEKEMADAKEILQQRREKKLQIRKKAVSAAQRVVTPGAGLKREPGTPRTPAQFGL
jgi:hypothetical protein